ncbi:MAG TPA: alpha amylase C-terminal domain-containing protein, partial [Anaerolineae bacterium]
NRMYQHEPSLSQLDYDWTGFEWIDPNDWEHSVLSYIRKASDPKDYLVIVCNFTPVVREGYRVGVPELCTYTEVLNSDSAYYYGSNVGNGLGLQAQSGTWQQQPCFVEMTLPPLAIVVLRPQR